MVLRRNLIGEELKDVGEELSAAELFADASAALGIIQRKGVGRIKHPDTQSLWTQEREVREQVHFKKVDDIF